MAPGSRHRSGDGLVGMLPEGSPESREKHGQDFSEFQAESRRLLDTGQKGSAEDWPERTISMRERQEIQEVLWRLSGDDHAASLPSRPGFDNGRVNEIRWYGTRGSAFDDPSVPIRKLLKMRGVLRQRKTEGFHLPV
jgi:hypothetical protein